MSKVKVFEVDDFKFLNDNYPVADQCAEIANEKVSESIAELARLRKALNKIAILGSSEMAYTSDFTTEVMGIVRGALSD